MGSVFYYNNGKKNPPIYGIKDGFFYRLRMDKTWDHYWSIEDQFYEEEDKFIEISETPDLYRPFDPNEYEWNYVSFENLEVRYNIDENLIFVKCKNGEPTRPNPDCADDNWDSYYAVGSLVLEACGLI